MPNLQPLELLDVTYRVDADDVQRIPAAGPAVVTANHPFGFLEAALLAALLRRIRPDFKIVANSLLASVPELGEGFIFVNAYGGSGSVRENRKPMRECLEWLAKGGILVLFPAGDVARLNGLERAGIPAYGRAESAAAHGESVARDAQQTRQDRRNARGPAGGGEVAGSV